MRYNNDPVSAAQVHDTVVNCVEFLRTTLDEMPSGPLSLNTSLSSSVSLVDQTTTTSMTMTTSGKPPVSASSSASHLSVNKHSAMSLYSPENSNHMMKPSLTKSYSSSGLIAGKSSSQNTSNVSASMSQTVVLSNVNENSITTNGHHHNYPHYAQNGSIHHMNHQHHRSVPPIIENNLSFTNNSTVIGKLGKIFRNC